MDSIHITQWYAISLGTLAALWYGYRLFIAALATLRSLAAYVFVKHVLYPQIPKLLRGHNTMTRFHCMLIAVYISGNIFCVAFKTTTKTQLRDRTGVMSLINLIPLFSGGRLNLVANYCGISSEGQARIHRWVGRVATLQAVTHATIGLTEKNFKIARVDLAGVVAAAGVLSLFLCSLFIFRRLFYETFRISHLACAMLTVVSLWYHLVRRKFSIRLYLIIAISVWAAVHIIKCILLLYRNAQSGHLTTQAKVETLPDAVKVSVRVSRPWNFQAGQYLHLRLPGISPSAWCQAHPFVLAWWENNSNGHATIMFLIQPRKGLTRNLLTFHGSALSALIEGPYGAGKNFGCYGTVLMFATGIGIAAQLPYIKRLLEGYRDSEIATKRISLFWQMDRESHSMWVEDWMDELLRQDTSYILNITLYVLEEPKNAEYGDIIAYGNHGRIDKLFGPMNVEELVQSELEKRKGQVVVVVCAEHRVKDGIRKTVGRSLKKNIRLEELEFHPDTSPNRRGGVWW